MPAILTLALSSATGGWWVGRKRCPLSAIKPTLAMAAAQQLRLQRGLHEFGYFTSCPDSLETRPDECRLVSLHGKVRSIPEPNYIYIYIYIYIYGHSQMPLTLVVDNHQIEQAQFSDYLSLKSERAFKNAESGHRFQHIRYR